MNEEGRREISEWVTLLALLLALTLAPLPFVTEDRYFRVLPASLALIVPLIMLLGTMFPRGLRLPLGRWSLRIAPPATAFITYYRLCRLWDETHSKFGWVADGLTDVQREHDDIDLEIQRINRRIADELGLAGNPALHLAGALLLKVRTDIDAVLADATATAISELRAEIAQPRPATTGELWHQLITLERVTDVAVALTQARLAALHKFVADTLPEIQGMTDDAWAKVEQREAATRTTFNEIRTALETLGTQIDEIDDQVADVIQPGRRRGRPTTWTREKTQALYADYLAWTGTYNEEFLQPHGLKNRTQMYELFDRYGLRRKHGELTDN